MRSIQDSYTPRRRTHDVTVSVAIKAPRDLIWGLLSQPENAIIFQPNILHAFQVPGTPKGIGEIVAMIFGQDGREYIQAYRTINEVAPEYSVSQRIGGEDGVTQATHWLTATTTGTYLQYRVEFTVPDQHKRYVAGYEKYYGQFSYESLQRLKVIAESRWQANKHGGL